MYPVPSSPVASPRQSVEMIGDAVAGVLGYAARGCLLTVPDLDESDRQLCKDLGRDENRYPMKVLCRLIGVMQQSTSAKVRESLGIGFLAIVERAPVPFVDESQLSLLDLTAMIAKETGEATAAVARHAQERSPASRRTASRELHEARVAIERGFMKLS
jgi:hypothetical protein